MKNRRVFIIILLVLTSSFVSWDFNLDAHAKNNPRGHRNSLEQSPVVAPAPNRAWRFKEPGRLGLQFNERFEGEDAEFRQQIAQQLIELNQVPPTRFLHFSWLDIPTARVDGWRGTILHASKTRLGWVATTRISPIVTMDDGGTPIVADCVYECYNSVNGKIELLGTMGSPTPHPGVRVEF